MTARWSPAARTDLLEAVRYLGKERSTSIADQFLDAVDATVELLLDGRFDGPVVVLMTGEEVRVWSVGLHRLYYRRRDGHLELVRLFHPRRRPIERK